MKHLKLNLRSKLFFLFLMGNLGYLKGQMPVHEEPRHRPVFQNNQIRILNVLLPPGDTTLYHVHHTPSVFVFFTNTVIGSQLQGATPATSRSTAGTILFENLASPHLRVHRVWNVDKDTFHVMDIELLGKDTGFVQKPLTLATLKLEIDTAWVRAYRLTLLEGNDFTLTNNNRSLILLSLNATTIQADQSGGMQNQTLKPGSFFEIKKGSPFSLKNTSDSTIRFVMLELPRQ